MAGHPANYLWEGGLILGLIENPSEMVTARAAAWADQASEAELKAYALAAAKCMTPAAREAFILHMRVA